MRGAIGSSCFSGAPKRIRTSDLLIGNQIPFAQPHQIKSFNGPATTVLPVRTLRIPVLRRTINNRSGINDRRVVSGGPGLFAPIRHLLPPPGGKRDISLYHRLEQHLEGVSIRARAGKDRLGLPVGHPGALCPAPRGGGGGVSREAPLVTTSLIRSPPWKECPLAHAENFPPHLSQLI